MIYGTGVDIVKINRIKKMINRWGDKFLKRIFSEGEIAYCQQKNNSAPHFAVRFAAKEAAAKMFGTGFVNIKWTDIEVKKDERGKPYLIFNNEALKVSEKSEINRVHLSLSHEKEYAIAQVIGEGGQK